MITGFLDETFSNYFRTVAHCHSPEVETRLESAGGRLFIDVFAHLPRLNCWVLCWSTAGSNTVNRVFIPDSNAGFAVGLGRDKPRVLHLPLKEGALSETPETDLTALYRRRGTDAVAYCPLHSDQAGPFGMIRLIGRASDIAALGYANGAAIQPVNIAATSTLPDPDLLPRLLGRWAGSVFGHRETKKPLTILLEAFASFFPRCHAMYWRRDFEKEEVSFYFSPTPNTAKVLHGLHAPIHSHDYMFAIVAEQGASEIVDDFPANLSTDLRINTSKWKRTEAFAGLCQSLGVERVSYIGIPLKVDDSVIGVVSLLSPRDQGDFREAARFARSALSEMGRTIDKGALSRASRLIRHFASEKASDERTKAHLIPVGRELVSKLVKELIPFGEVTVGSIEARLGAEESAATGLPPSVSALIQKQLIQLVVSEHIVLFVIEPDETRHPDRGVLAVPVPAGLPFVLFVTGPLSLLGGRSLRSALEEMQAVLLVSIAVSERSSALAWDISNWREHLALWSQVHDIKNATAAFGTPLADLVNVAQYGTHDDLKEEVFRFKERFARTITEFEAKCDQSLRGAGFRKRELVPIYDAVRRAWAAVLRSSPDVMLRCRGHYVGDRSLQALTYTSELELVLRNLLTNVVKHFQRQAKVGTITFRCDEQVANNGVQISITDDVPELGAVKKVNSILDDPTSQSTLRRLIKPIVERQLQGRIWAEPNRETDSVLMLLGLPAKASAH